MGDKGGIGWGGLLFVGLIIWFFFFRVDVKDFWYEDKGEAWVQYCGSYSERQCSGHPEEWLTVVHTSKDKAASSEDKWVHNFTIYFNNGGHINAEGTCDKVDNLSYDRVCNVTAYDSNGDWYSYKIHN